MPKSSTNVDQDMHATSLVGEQGEQAARHLAEYMMGKRSFTALGPGFDRAPNGVLRVTVDEASYRALELDK